MERGVAEDILSELFKRKSLTEAYIKLHCIERNVDYNKVRKLIGFHIEKPLNAGYGDDNLRILKPGSANFVYTGCWSGEEKREEDRFKRELKENSKNRWITILASIIGAVAGSLITYFIMK